MQRVTVLVSKKLSKSLFSFKSHVGNATLEPDLFYDIYYLLIWLLNSAFFLYSPSLILPQLFNYITVFTKEAVRQN